MIKEVTMLTLLVDDKKGANAKIKDETVRINVY